MDHLISEAPGAAASTTLDARATQPLWDAPVRVMHVLMIVSTAGAWITSEAEGWRPVHISFGLSLAGLMLLRLVWGFVGSGPARFINFVRGPAAVVAHFRALLDRRAAPHAGHNPAAGWAVLALIGASLAVSGTGWLAYTLGEALEEPHEVVANGLLLLVGLHVAAVVLTGWLTGERLVPAMISGRKRLPAGAQPTPRMHRGLAALILVAVLGFWAWGMGPATPFTGDAERKPGHESHEGDGDGERDRD